MFGCLFEANHDFIEPLRHGGIYPRNTDTGVLTSRRTSRNRPSPSSLAPRSSRQSNQIIRKRKALLDTRKALVLIVLMCSCRFTRLWCG